MFLQFFLFFMPKSESPQSLFAHSFFWATWAFRYRHSLQKSDREWFAQVAQEQPRAIPSGRSIQKNDGSDSLFFMNIALTLTKNEWITRKTDEQIPNPDYVWVTPALAPKPSQDNWRSSICLHWNNIYTIHIQYSIIQMQYSIFTVNYSRYMSTP